MKKVFLFIPVLLLGVSCGRTVSTTWSESEKELINGENEIMRVLTVDDQNDLAVLRAGCSDFTPEDLASGEYSSLARKMVSTVTSPEQDGVGIAGPQVGLNRRVVAVMRYDKEGAPFEVFPNIRITASRGEMQAGPEGCLSVPGKAGIVDRYQDIDIEYTSPKTFNDTTETVQGYTAVIFQHECDHLDGVIYTDKVVEFIER